jgi:hypothetical protein
MKAVLMASAYHNVDGFFVTRPGVDPDGRDGAGVPRADRALGILDEASWTDRFIDETDFDADGYLLNAPSFYAEAYDIVRVALVWESCPAALHSGQQFSLTADLDLILEGPSELPEPEARKVSAAPLFDNRELIQTLVSHGGEYRLRIKSNRLEPCETSAHRARMGIAWAHVPFVDEYLTPPP